MESRVNSCLSIYLRARHISIYFLSLEFPGYSGTAPMGESIYLLVPAKYIPNSGHKKYILWMTD